MNMPQGQVLGIRDSGDWYLLMMDEGRCKMEGGRGVMADGRWNYGTTAIGGEARSRTADSVALPNPLLCDYDLQIRLSGNAHCPIPLGGTPCQLFPDKGHNLHQGPLCRDPYTPNNF